MTAPRGRSLWYQAWRRLLANRMAVAGGMVVVAMAALALAAPLVSPYGYDETSAAQYHPPSWRHPMGTDIHGRDLLTRVLYGARLSLGVGFVATAVSLLIGVGYGAVSGYAGGKTDELMMRVVDIIYSLPYMFFVIILVAVFGRSVLLLFVALGAVQWLTVARIVRGQVLSIKEKEFIQAGRAIGAGHLRIILHHLLPNVLGPVVVYTTLTVPAVMLQEAFLSFLGLGVPPPASSWGTLIADGASAINALRIYWWLLLFPGAAMAVTLFAMNFLGDGLRDAMDPRLR
ncbi:MAG TPA: ABC transporter permease [bacterium]|jgi:oligopeptide transport system permease protein|nr:ABC transporter permease [Chlamydiota bacterium]HOE27742.1 ABC transporter permease [bacterium]HQM52168.1 ABC transporter permease [bacterium]